MEVLVSTDSVGFTHVVVISSEIVRRPGHLPYLVANPPERSQNTICSFTILPIDYGIAEIAPPLHLVEAILPEHPRWIRPVHRIICDL